MYYKKCLSFLTSIGYASTEISLTNTEIAKICTQAIKVKQLNINHISQNLTLMYLEIDTINVFLMYLFFTES